MAKIILSADSTCDLGEELKTKYQVHYYPFHIIFRRQSNIRIMWILRLKKSSRPTGKERSFRNSGYRCGRIYRLFPKMGGKWLPSDPLEPGFGHFLRLSKLLYGGPGTGKRVSINSGNLSSAIGLLVVEAGKRIFQGMPAPQIQKEIQAMTGKCHGSFVLDTLEFLHAGGRCSTIAALGANLLRLKPCIEVDSRDATMHVGKNTGEIWTRCWFSIPGIS